MYGVAFVLCLYAAFRFLINGLQFKIAAALNVLSKNYSTQRPI